MKEFRNTGKIEFNREMWDRWHSTREADADAGRAAGLTQGIEQMRQLLDARDITIERRIFRPRR